jgi:uncharacterized phage infection (PIP) family protein YhgE
MATATLDDGVQNLSQFCALLAQTNDMLQANAQGFDQLSEQYQELEQSAEEHIGGLGDQCQEIATETAESADEATGELDNLAEAAQQAHQAELAEVEQGAEVLEQELTDRLQKDQEEIGQHAETLNRDGFDALEATLTTVMEGLDGAQSEAEEAFGNLIAALDSEEQQFKDNVAEQALEDAAEAVKAEMEALDGVAEEAAEGWLDAIPNEVVSECVGIVGPLQGTYDGFRQAAEDEGRELIETVSTLGDEAARLIGVEFASDLEQAWDRTLTPAFGDWEDGLGELKTALDEGEQAALVLDPLVDELLVAKETVREIDRTIDNMG